MNLDGLDHIWLSPQFSVVLGELVEVGVERSNQGATVSVSGTKRHQNQPDGYDFALAYIRIRIHSKRFPAASATTAHIVSRPNRRNP